MILARLVSVPVLALLSSGALAQDALVHMGQTPDFPLLDPATMAYEAVLALGPTAPLLGLGYAGQGVFYGLSGFASSVSVVRIDLGAPSFSVIGNTNIPWSNVGCGVDATTGAVYVLGSPQSGFGTVNLYRVDLQTGSLTVVAPTTAQVAPSTFTIDAQGNAYAVGSFGSGVPGLPFHPRLWAIDLATGQGTIVASFASVNFFNTQFHGSAVRADGFVWLATDNGLWKLDPITQTGTQLTSFAALTLAFAPAAEVGLGYPSGCHGTPTACPCPHVSIVNRNGCSNSAVDAGGNLRAFGAASLSNDTLRFVAANLPNSTGLFFQGSAHAAPILFGDGLRCTGGAVRRLGGGVIANNAFAYPDATQLSVSVRAQIVAPGTFHYQTLYRDSAGFCNGSAFNLTNSLHVTWAP